MTWARVRGVALASLAWLVLVVSAVKFFSRFGPVFYLLLVAPFAAVERRVARARAKEPDRPRVAVLAYAHLFAGLSLLWYARDAVVPCIVLVSSGLLVLAYAGLGRRFHLMLGVVSVLLVPLLSFGVADPPNPLVFDSSPARDERFPSWLVAVLVWAPTRVPVGVMVGVLTALYWVNEWYEYERQSGRDGDG